jgi:quinolinate synthase
MVTECSMSDNVAVEFPDVEFVRPCALCPHMKRITLPKILHSLQAMEHRVELDAETSGRARRALEQMLGVGRREPRERRDRPERPERREIAR